MTLWENMFRSALTFPGYVHNHPNYYSHYMNATLGWPSTHVRVAPMGDETNEGWRRDGWWQVTGTAFRKGACTMWYNRTCPGDRTKAASLETGQVGPVLDVQFAFAPRVTYTDTVVLGHTTTWFETGGECVNYVLDGCFNNGTCSAPGTVRHAAASCCVVARAFLPGACNELLVDFVLVYW